MGVLATMAAEETSPVWVCLPQWLQRRPAQCGCACRNECRGDQPSVGVPSTLQSFVAGQVLRLPATLWLGSWPTRAASSRCSLLCLCAGEAAAAAAAALSAEVPPLLLGCRALLLRPFLCPRFPGPCSPPATAAACCLPACCTASLHLSTTSMKKAAWGHMTPSGPLALRRMAGQESTSCSRAGGQQEAYCTTMCSPACMLGRS